VSGRAVSLIVGALAVVGGVAIALVVAGRFPPWPFASSPDEGASGAGSDAGGDAAVRRQASPLSSAQLAAPLVNGAWVTACGAPAKMKVVVKVDVRLGRAVKTDVQTDPPDTAVSTCIERASHDLRWDVSPKVGHATVRY
jgi:hypothetical protein